MLLAIFGRAERPLVMILLAVSWTHRALLAAEPVPKNLDETKVPRSISASAAFAGPFTHRLEGDSEILRTSDLFLTESGLRYERELGGLRLDASFIRASFDEDYRPVQSFDIFGFPEHLHEERYGGQATVRPKVSESLELLVSGGAYDGFQDYRRVWLNNYYRQQYHNPRFPPRPGYQEATPKGWNVLAGLRWEYLPLAGFLEAHGGYSLDEVAPGYEVDPATGFAIRGRADLYTSSFRISSENVLGARVRTFNEVDVTDTTRRELRVSWQGKLNCALSQRWVLRSYGGYTTEAPQFEAYWVGAALEVDLTRHCTLIADGHYYRDTGEIVDPFLLSSAAPGLETYQASIGARFTWPRLILKLSVGPYFTRYKPLARISRAFSNLYRDRDWGLAQMALSVSF